MHPRTPHEIEQARRDCESLLTKRALLSALAGLSPIVGSDLTADTALLLDLFPRINRRFGFAPDQLESLDEKTRIALYQFVKTSGKRIAAKIVTRELIVACMRKLGVRLAAQQIAKFVPVIGLVLSGAINYAGMRYLGRAHIQECVDLATALLEKGSQFQG